MAKQSLLGRNTPLAPAPEPSTALATLGGFAGDDTHGAPPKEPTGVFVPYVFWASMKNAEKWLEVAGQIPGLAEHDIILSIDPKPVKLASLSYFHLAAKRYWADLDPATYLPKRTYLEDPGKIPSKPREFVEVAALVRHGEVLVPASIRFADAQCAAANAGIIAARQAVTPEWAGMSADHAFTARIADPNARFSVNVTCGTRMGKSSGRRYRVASAVCKPTTAAEVVLLSQMSTDPDFVATLDLLRTQFGERVAEIVKLSK